MSNAVETLKNCDISNILGDIINPETIKPISALILGESKTGKSTFAASSATNVSKTLMLNFENGLSFIKETENLRIFPRQKSCSMEDLKSIYKALKGKHDFKTIVFDTGDEFWNILQNDFVEQNGRKMQLQDYLPLYQKYLTTLKSFKDLGLNIIITAHTRRFEDDPKRVLALSEKLGKQVSAWVDMILHMTVNSKGERVLVTQPTFLLDAGHRCLGKPLPSEIVNPVWENIIDTVSKPL